MHPGVRDSDDYDHNILRIRMLELFIVKILQSSAAANAVGKANPRPIGAQHTVVKNGGDTTNCKNNDI